MENNDSLPEKEKQLQTEIDIEEKLKSELEVTFDDYSDPIILHYDSAATAIYEGFIKPLEDKIKTANDQFLQLANLLEESHKRNMEQHQNFMSMVGKFQQQQAYIIELEQKLPKK